MCLAIPGKVIEISNQSGLSMGVIDYGGVQKEACLAYVPEIKIGDYAIVHAGFAISILDEKEAQKSFEVWDEMLETESKEFDPEFSPEKRFGKDKTE